MDKLTLKEQVETIRQAFGYINRFRNKTFVIKIDSALITHDFFPALIKDIVLLHQMGIRIVLVPGASTRINEILATFKIKSKVVNGIRISPAETIPFIKMAAFDVSNKVMTLLAENDTDAVIGNWVKARAIGVRDGIDYESAGLVEKVKTDIVKNVLEDAMIPIFPNIGWNAKGKPYNISSNELSLAIAKELRAAKLFFMTDNAGLQAKGHKVPKSVYVSTEGTISQLTMTEAEAFLADNRTKEYKQEYEMVELAYEACEAGVERVHIIDGRVEGMLLKEIFSNRGFGTMIYANQHGNIRPMAFTDIPEVLGIMQPFVEKGILVPRTAKTLEDQLEHFAVYDVDGTIHAGGALIRYSDNCAEIAGVAVDETYSNLGIGGKMVSYFVERARSSGIERIFVLTTHTSDWFDEFGFKRGTIADLPKEKREGYNKKRNSRILVLPLV
jgi:amino-acid N-acetyltransferase